MEEKRSFKLRMKNQKPDMIKIEELDESSRDSLSIDSVSVTSDLDKTLES